MAGNTASFALKQRLAVGCRRRHGAFVEIGTMRDQRIEILGDRLADRTVGRLTVTGSGKHFHIKRILLHAFLHQPHIHVHQIVFCDHFAGYVVQVGA